MPSITLDVDLPGFPAGTILTQAKPGERYETADGKLWLSENLAAEIVTRPAKDVIRFIPQKDGTIARVQMIALDGPISKVELPADVFVSAEEAQAAIDVKVKPVVDVPVADIPAVVGKI